MTNMDTSTDATMEAAAAAIVQALDQHLPPQWKETPERCDQILEVTTRFLFATDRSWPTADRQLCAAKRVAKEHHIALQTVQAHCTRELYGTGTSRQIDRFREALEAVEKDLRG